MRVDEKSIGLKWDFLQGRVLLVYISPNCGDINQNSEISELLKKLGKYKNGKTCLYIKNLDDIDKLVLAQIIKITFES